MNEDITQRNVKDRRRQGLKRSLVVNYVFGLWFCGPSAVGVSLVEIQTGGVFWDAGKILQNDVSSWARYFAIHRTTRAEVTQLVMHPVTAWSCPAGVLLRTLSRAPNTGRWYRFVRKHVWHHHDYFCDCGKQRFLSGMSRFKSGPRHWPSRRSRA